MDGSLSAAAPDTHGSNGSGHLRGCRNWSPSGAPGICLLPKAPGLCPEHQPQPHSRELCERGLSASCRDAHRPHTSPQPSAVLLQRRSCVFAARLGLSPACFSQPRAYSKTQRTSLPASVTSSSQTACSPGQDEAAGVTALAACWSDAFSCCV